VLNENVKMRQQSGGEWCQSLFASKQQQLVVVCWPHVFFICKLYSAVTVFWAQFALFSDDDFILWSGLRVVVSAKDP
jgi:hypothetical protein